MRLRSGASPSASVVPDEATDLRGADRRVGDRGAQPDAAQHGFDLAWAVLEVDERDRQAAVGDLDAHVGQRRHGPREEEGRHHRGDGGQREEAGRLRPWRRAAARTSSSRSSAMNPAGHHSSSEPEVGAGTSMTAPLAARDACDIGSLAARSSGHHGDGQLPEAALHAEAGAQLGAARAAAATSA